MGRKKKNQKFQEEVTQEKKRFDFEIEKDIKKSIVAVFLFALALIMLFGFFGKAGVVGKSLNQGVGSLIGWTKWIFPIFLVIAGGILILKEKTSFYVSKIIGLFVLLMSIAGFFHWFLEADKMLEVAKSGGNGGYLGFAVAYLGIKYLGSAGSFVVIIFLILAGLIFTFNVSLSQLIAKIKEEKKKDVAVPAISEETVSIPPVEEEKNKEEKKPEDVAANIAKIEFVEGPDQYVDKNLERENLHSAEFVTRNFSPGNGKGGTKKKGKNGNGWILPPLDLLEESSGEAKGGDTEKNAEIIEKTLKNFGIEVGRGEIKTGPAVTQYSFRPAVGIKISKILSLQNDIALALAAHPIRIEAPIPGKSLIGIEVPNKVSATVRLKNILESQDFFARKSNLTLCLGEDVSGNFEFGYLPKMPHLLIAGATGTGKSVCVNSIITSLLYQNSPEDMKMIMVDPKRVELSLYNGIPHLLTEVIVENSKVVNALKWAVSEMEKRYKLLQETGSRDIGSYNEKFEKGEKRKIKNIETGETEEIPLEKLHYIVIIIDELSDLMGSHGKEVEGAIVRLAQMARAVGIHLIVSTQRPEVKVITGLIKANITTRIAFQVATQIDSRTILDMAGAEKLLGNGDMLFLSASSPKPKRIQGVFISESEVKRVVKFVKEQGDKRKAESEIGEEITEFKNGNSGVGSVIPLTQGQLPDSIAEFGSGSDGEDDLYEAVKEEVLRTKKASASFLQRRFRIGYSRAARILDILEERGVVGPAEGSKPREVYGGGNNEEGVAYEDNQDDQKIRDKWEM